MNKIEAYKSLVRDDGNVGKAVMSVSDLIEALERIEDKDSIPVSIIDTEGEAWFIDKILFQDEDGEKYLYFKP